MSRPSTTLAAGCAVALALMAVAGALRGEQPPAPPIVLAQHKHAKLPKPAASDAAAGHTDKPSAAPGAADKAPAPEVPPNTIGEFQPVLHAQGAKIVTCMDTIVGESAAVIDSAHTAISSWSKAAPNDNVFLSIVGLSYSNKMAPNAAAVLFAAPVGPGKCEGGTVQVYPIAQSCTALQAKLIKDGQTVTMLRALPVIETKAGFRNVLIPTTGGGCVLIAVGLRQ